MDEFDSNSPVFTLIIRINGNNLNVQVNINKEFLGDLTIFLVLFLELDTVPTPRANFEINLK